VQEASANAVEHAYAPGVATYEVSGTCEDGVVTFVIRPTFRLKLVPVGSQPFFVRARKATDRLIGGVSTRRLVNLAIRA
jgi:hypothetical protein